MPPAKFVNFIQNHDQLANSGSGKRVHLMTSFNRYRALTALFLAAPEMQARMPDPGDPQTFTHSKLDLNERNRYKEAHVLHRDLLSLRRNDPVF